MNYQIIKDEKLLRDFIEFLPELKENEKFYCCLFARSKYNKSLTHIKSDKAQLKRFVSDKIRLYDKIKQLEIEIDAYKQKDTSVPEDALALYITPNPRNMFKATVNTMVKLATSIRDQNVSMNPHQEAMSEIQKAKSRTVYVDFDIDAEGEKLEALLQEAQDYVNKDACTLLKTRGGVHLLVKPDLVEEKYKKSFYQNLAKLADQAGDTMIPCPGTNQGGFTPHFISY